MTRGTRSPCFHLSEISQTFESIERAARCRGGTEMRKKYKHQVRKSVLVFHEGRNYNNRHTPPGFSGHTCVGCSDVPVLITGHSFLVDLRRSWFRVQPSCRRQVPEYPSRHPSTHSLPAPRRHVNHPVGVPHGQSALVATQSSTTSFLHPQ